MNQDVLVENHGPRLGPALARNDFLRCATRFPVFVFERQTVGINDVLRVGCLVIELDSWGLIRGKWRLLSQARSYSRSVSQQPEG
jgi:hypothetical protein